ncbi:hypothetical protein ACS0PU_011891 [Formica fusca]
MHQRYCGCCSLKSRTIIIGVLRIVVAVVSLIVIFTMDIKWETINGLDKTAEIIFVIHCCMTIPFCTLLVIGSIKKNAFMMLSWMVLDMIMSVGLLVSAFYIAIVLFINDMVSGGRFSFGFGLATVMINRYMWLAVYYHFQELKIESRNCAQERVSTENRIIIDDGGPARPRDRSDPTSAISFT